MVIKIVGKVVVSIIEDDFIGGLEVLNDVHVIDEGDQVVVSKNVNLIKQNDVFVKDVNLVAVVNHDYNVVIVHWEDFKDYVIKEQEVIIEVVVSLLIYI